MPAVFLSLWGSHPEISLHSGEVASVSQFLSFTELSRSKGQDGSCDSSVYGWWGRGEEKNSSFLFPHFLAMERRHCPYNQNAQGASSLDFSMKCFDPRKVFHVNFGLLVWEEHRVAVDGKRQIPEII